ncbi:nuclear receptor corepressor 1-like [Haemaphysalis longicornis]
MAGEEPSENLVPSAECSRLRLRQQRDPDFGKPSLPNPSPPPMERTKVDDTPGKSVLETVISTLPKEGGPRFPQERSSEDDLVVGIKRLDRGTDKVKLPTGKLRNRQPEPEACDDFAGNGDDVHDIPGLSPSSIVEVACTKTRENACLALAVVENFGPQVIENEDHQPSYIAICIENKKNIDVFKRALMLHFKRKFQVRYSITETLSDTRSDPMQAPQNETGQRHIRAEWEANEQKQLQFFAKQFSEQKKKRPEHLRRSKAGQPKRMGADVQVTFGLHKTEKSRQRNRNSATISPMLNNQPCHPRHADFHNLIQDQMAEFEESYLAEVSKEPEKVCEKFIEHPKKFHIIAYSLGRSVPDCVQ